MRHGWSRWAKGASGGGSLSVGLKLLQNDNNKMSVSFEFHFQGNLCGMRAEGWRIELMRRDIYSSWMWSQYKMILQEKQKPGGKN